MKKLLPVILGVIILGGGMWLVVRNKKVKDPTPVVEEKVELPVNVIPVEERPFITLTPDKSGRNLEISITNAPESDQLEYEILYNAGDVQEGGLGALSLTGSEPFKKSILLGTRSAGGATTYHEGVTGGSLTVTYGETRLKEQFNFLRFDPADPVVSSSDLRFSVTLPKTSLKKDMVVVVMKPFGLPGPLTEGAKLVAGPYVYTTPDVIKGSVEVEMKLPAGEYTNVSLYTYAAGKWTELKTNKKGEDTLAATVTSGNTFIAVTEQ